MTAEAPAAAVLLTRPTMLDDRYWKKVNKTDTCWLWTGVRTQNGNGYGNHTFNRKPFGAHRLMYADIHGPIPPGMDICHTCDVRHCVNPDHLFMGTRSDNMRDCASKGRNGMQRHPEKCHFHGKRHLAPKGERCGAAKLTEENVRKIVALAQAGTKAADIAAQFGIGPTHVRTLASGRAWKHLGLVAPAPEAAP